VRKMLFRFFMRGYISSLTDRVLVQNLLQKFSG